MLVFFLRETYTNDLSEILVEQMKLIENVWNETFTTLVLLLCDDVFAWEVFGRDL